MSPVNGINNDRQRVINSGNRTQKENATSKKTDDKSIWQNFVGKNKTQKAKSDEDGDYFTSTMKETLNNLAKNDSFYKQDEKGRLVANKTKSVIASQGSQ